MFFGLNPLIIIAMAVAVILIGGTIAAPIIWPQLQTIKQLWQEQGSPRAFTFRVMLIMFTVVTLLLLFILAFQIYTAFTQPDPPNLIVPESPAD